MTINSKALVASGVEIGQAVFMEESQPIDLEFFGRRYLRSGYIEDDASKFDTSIFTSKLLGALTSRNSQFGTTDIQGVAFGNDTFVAVGSSGKVSTSDDGEVWLSRTPYDSENLSGVQFGNGVFVAYTSATEIRVSTNNGASWIEQEIFGVDGITGVFYVNNTWFITYYTGGVGRVAKSSDLVVWDILVETFTGVPSGFVFANGLYMLSVVAGIIYTSADLLTWSSTVTEETSILSMATNGFETITSGSSGASQISYDSLIWDSTISGVTQTLNGVYFDGVAFMCGANERVLASVNSGLTWSVVNLGSGGAYRDITSGLDKLVVVGDDGMLLSAPLAHAAGSTVAYEENNEHQYIRIS